MGVTNPTEEEEEDDEQEDAWDLFILGLTLNANTHPLGQKQETTQMWEALGDELDKKIIITLFVFVVVVVVLYNLVT